MERHTDGVSSRRRQLLIGGAAAMTGLAGCGGGSGGNGGGNDGQGVWRDSDGERLTINVKAPSNGTWPLNAQTAAQTLQDFGIQCSPILREAAAYGSDIDSSEFTMAINIWGNRSGNSHPHGFFSEAFSRQRASTGQFDPTAMEVPMPVGDPEGDLETVDVNEKLSELARASTEEQSERVTELAWIYNQTLPRLPLMNGVARRWLTTDEWDLPSKSSQWMRDNPVNMVLLNAKVQATSTSDDEAFTVPTANANPNDIQWNQYFVQAGTRTPTRLLFEPLFNSAPVANDVEAPDLPERTPVLGEAVRLGDGTVTIEIADDRVWTDGDPVTAEDLAVKYRLEQYLGQASGDVWDSLTVTDDQTIEFDVGERNPDLAASVLLSAKLENTKRDNQFAEWVEAYDDATTEEERTSVSQEVVQERVEDLVSYGLWKIESRSSSRILMTVHEDHPLADDVNFDTVEMPSLSNNQTRWQSLGQGRIDALFHATAPASTEENFPDHAMRLPFDNLVGDGIVFNHGREPFDDRRVRQAVAMLINRWTNTHNAKDFVSTIEYPTGLTNRLSEDLIGDDLEQFERYGYKESKTAEAERLLQAAGYTRE